MAKVHIRLPDNNKAMCGLSDWLGDYFYSPTDKNATCKTCLKAYEAWKRRQREA